MRRDRVVVTFGGKADPHEITQFDSLEEATRELSEDAVLTLINAAYRTDQLVQIRKALEHHPRGSR